MRNYFFFVLGCVLFISCGSSHETVLQLTSLDQKIVDGRPANPGEFSQVVYLKVFASSTSKPAWCTATLVGSSVIITAAHCAEDGRENGSFKLNGKEYDVHLTQSPWYSPSGIPYFHDVALGLLSEPVPNVLPRAIGGETSQGIKLVLAGYGCTNSNGTGGNDGILRVGENVVSSFNEFELVFSRSSGAVTCFGDSGGPTFVVSNGVPKQLGVHSTGDYANVYDMRTDIEKSKEFFKNWTQENLVDICGVTQNCQ